MLKSPHYSRHPYEGFANGQAWRNRYRAKPKTHLISNLSDFFSSQVNIYPFFFFTKTSNFGPKSELSCSFLWFELENVQNMFLKVCGIAFQPAFFFRKFLCFRFFRSLKAIKRRWATFGLSFTVVNINKIIFVIKLGLHEGRRSPVIIWIVKFVLPII